MGDTKKREPEPRIRDIRAAVPTDPAALLSIRDLQVLMPISRQSLWRSINRGTFPPPDKRLPGSRRPSWRRSTYDAWIATNDEPTENHRDADEFTVQAGVAPATDRA